MADEPEKPKKKFLVSLILTTIEQIETVIDAESEEQAEEIARKERLENEMQLAEPEDYVVVTGVIEMDESKYLPPRSCQAEPHHRCKPQP